MVFEGVAKSFSKLFSLYCYPQCLRTIGKICPINKPFAPLPFPSPFLLPMPKFGDIYVVKAGDEFEGFTGKGQAKAYAKRTEGGTSPTRVGRGGVELQANKRCL